MPIACNPLIDLLIYPQSQERLAALWLLGLS